MDDMVSTVRVLGETLLHFLWQGAAIGVLTALALKAAAHRTAHHRYLICLIALIACVLAPVVTAVLLADRDESVLASVTERINIEVGLSTEASPAVQEVAATEPSPVSFDLLRAIVGTWILGVLAVTTYYALQWRSVGRVRRYAIPLAVSEPFTAIANNLLQKWKATTRVPVMVSEFVSSPMVIGVIRPMIVFPAATLARMPAQDFELILLHEIAHILRRDTWVNAIQVFLEIVFFYHPAVHWLSRRARLERECACDDFVVAASGSAYKYAQALTTLAFEHKHKPAVALGATGGDLLPRLRYLAGECIDSESYPRNPLQFALLGLLFGIIWMNALIEPSRTDISSEPIVVPTQAEWASQHLRPVEEIALPPLTLPVQRREPARAERSRVAESSAEQPRPLAVTSAPARAQAEVPALSTAAGTSVAAPNLEPMPAAMPSTGMETIAPPEAPAIETLFPEVEAAAPAAAEATPGAAPSISNLAVTMTSSPMPEYPLRARLDGIEGKVSAIVHVGPNGQPKGLQIVSAEPLGVFEGSVRRALMRWRYDLSKMPETAQNMEVAYQLNFTISGVASTATGICATATASRTCMPR